MGQLSFPVGESVHAKLFDPYSSTLGNSITLDDPTLADGHLSIECPVDGGRRRFTFRIDDKGNGHWYDENEELADDVVILQGVIRASNTSGSPLAYMQSGIVPQSSVAYSIPQGLSIISPSAPVAFSGMDILAGLSPDEIDVDFLNFSESGTNREYAVVSDDGRLVFYEGDNPIPADKVVIPPGTPIWYYHSTDSAVTLRLSNGKLDDSYTQCLDAERPVNISLPLLTPDEEGKPLSTVNLNVRGATFPKEERTMVAVKVKNESKPIPAVLISSNVTVKVVKLDGKPILQKKSDVEALVVREEDCLWLNDTLTTVGKKFFIGNVESYAIFPIVWGTLISILTTVLFNACKGRLKQIACVISRSLWRSFCFPFRLLVTMLTHFVRIRRSRSGEIHILIGKCRRKR